MGHRTKHAVNKIKSQRATEGMQVCNRLQEQNMWMQKKGHEMHLRVPMHGLQKPDNRRSIT